MYINRIHTRILYRKARGGLGVYRGWGLSPKLGGSELGACQVVANYERKKNE